MSPRGFLTSAFGTLFVWLVFVTPFSISAIEITFPFLLLAWLFTIRWPEGRGAASAKFLSGNVPPEGGASSNRSRWPWSQDTLSRLSPEEKTTLLALLAYVLLCTGSVLYSRFLYTTAQGLIGKLYEYVLLFVIGLFAARVPSVPHRCIRAIQVGAWMVILHALLQEWTISRATYSTIHDPILGHLLGNLRMTGPYKNPNDLATYLMVVALLLISWAFHPNRGPSPSQILLLVLILGCLAWTRSRGAFLGLWMGLGLLVFFNRRDKRFVAVLGGTLVVVTAFFLYLARHNLGEVLTLSDIASRERMTMWNTAWAMIHAQPIFGVGYNTFMANYGNYVAGHNLWPAYAHNCYLQIAAETGLAGLISFLGFLFCFLWTCTRALRSQTGPLLIGLFAGLFAFLVQSAFDTNLYALRQAVLFWTLAGLATGLSGSILNKTEG